MTLNRIFLSFFLFGFLALPLTIRGEDWALSGGNLWSRDPGATRESTEAASDRGDKIVRKIDHSGKDDWALSEGRRIPVRPGDVYQLDAVMKTERVGEAWGTATISVVTRTKDGEVVSWSYGARELNQSSPWTKLRSTFIVPHDIETIEPRIIGHGPLSVRIDGFSAKKIGHRSLDVSETKPIVLENRFLKVDVDFATGRFSITDQRTKRTWLPAEIRQNFVVVPKKEGESCLFNLLATESLFEIGVFLTLEANSPEMLIRLEAKGPMTGNIAYPPPMSSKPGDRLIVPENEGIGYPVEEKDVHARRLIAYGGHGICMAFWGQIEDATGAGMMGILETPDDASVELSRDEQDRLRIGVVWEPSQKEFRYARTLRLVFFEKGAHVAVCKRYREYAQKIGLFKPFTEKVKTNPNIDLLLGAANIWNWDADKVALVKEMKELGFERILWSSGGNAEQIAELNTIENVLTSRYDIYQDIMDPDRYDDVWVHGDWVPEAWPQDINWTDVDGTWRKGWYVDQKDKTKPRIPCAVICDARALPYARKRITEELKTKPFKARFIDTTVAAPWFECYHPDHPMTRSDSRRHKMELLELVGRLGLVCGSETGHDASVPYCDYFEGMLSLGPYRVHESGRNMIRLVEDVPPQIEHFQVNPALRLPLWELVYHDCTVAQWYWGDYNNKLPKVWRKRDLFNALYGTPPMYMFTKAFWNENKERFAESYRTAATTARASAYAEMTDHRILSPDRMVQQTFFSNGVKVTVNFGTTAFDLPDGTTLAPLDWKMDQ